MMQRALEALAKLGRAQSLDVLSGVLGVGAVVVGVVGFVVRAPSADVAQMVGALASASVLVRRRNDGAGPLAAVATLSGASVARALADGL